MTAAAEPTPTLPRLGDLARQFPAWLKKNVPATIASAVAAGVVGYIANVWIMAVRYEGFQAPSGAAATTQGNLLQGGLFWAMFSSLLFGVVGYRRAVGGKQFWRDVRGLPRALAALFRADGNGARAHLLWGAALGLLLSLVLSPSMGAVMALGILAAAPSVLGSILSSLGSRIVQAVVKPFSPEGARPVGILAVAVGLLGSASALTLGFIVTATLTKVILAIACAAGAIYLSKRPAIPPAAAVLLLGITAAIAWDLLHASRALADDGGFAECGASWRQWWDTCAGADRVRSLATGGSIAAAIGGPIGTFIGQLIGGGLGPGPFGGITGWGPGADGDGPSATTLDDPAGGDERAIRGWVNGLVNDPAFTEWRREHPEFTGDPGGGEFESYMQWRHGRGLPDPALILPSQHAPAFEPETVEAGAADPGDLEAPEAQYTPGEFEEPGDEDFEEPDEFEEPGAPEAPTPFLDPRTGEPLTVNDGAWPDVPVGSVWVDGQWMTPDDAADFLGVEPPGETVSDEGLGDEEGEGEDGDRPTRWREEQEPGTGREGVDDDTQRLIDEGVIAVGPDGEVLRDPETGEPLRVDDDGLVRIGDLPMTPEEAAEAIRVNEDWQDARAHGQELVDRLGDLAERIASTDDPVERAALEGEWRRTVADLNADYSGKNIIKSGDPTLGRMFDEEIQRIYGEVDADTARRLAEMGVNIGGEPFDPSKLVDVRNALSAGTPGMDRDLALDEWRLRNLRDGLAGAGIGYDEYHTALENELARTTPGTPDYERLQGTLTQLEADAPGMKEQYLAELEERLAAAEPGSRQARAIELEMAAAQQRAAGRATLPVEFETGSPETRAVTNEYLAARDANRITIDYGQAIDAVTERLQAELQSNPGGPDAQRLQERLDQLNADAAGIKDRYLAQLDAELRAAPPGSPEAQRLQAEIDAAQARPAGRDVVEISPSKWNDIAQGVYGDSYQHLTGTDADKAYQALTQSANPEAYKDPRVLANDPRNVPFQREWAEQTASVSPYKTFHNDHMAELGHITEAEATQENARGYGKDLGGKTIPLLESDPGVDPAKLDQLRRIQETMTAIGKGDIPPGYADAALRNAVPEIPGLTMDQAMRIADANLEAGIKWRGDFEAPGAPETERVGAPETERVGAPETERVGVPDADRPADVDTGGSRLTGAFGAAGDLAMLEHYTSQNIARGMDPVEAAAVAAAQVSAGNAAVMSGVADPRMSMVGGALLPGGMQNMLPDQAIENWVGTAAQAGNAGLQAIHDSIDSGTLDTTAIDQFAQDIVNREGIDPFKGIGQGAQLFGEEMARTDGGNVASDLQQIYETGAGAEVINEQLSNFQQGVQSGEYGAPLQGIDHIMNAAGEFAADPGTTVGQFVDDVRNIWNHGVGDGYWEDALHTTGEVIDKTPLLGTIKSGYEQVYQGVNESGVGGFAQEMWEGGTALGGEAIDAVGNAASNTYDYLRSWF